jgi:hypothetical protein
MERKRVGIFIYPEVECWTSAVRSYPDLNTRRITL